MKKIGIILLTLCCAFSIQAQHPAFWNDIQQFKKQDSISSHPIHPIVFAGSSSFTLWKDVQSYFPNKEIINRGFGGSSITDLLRYLDDVILKYKPKQVVIYCGENDFANDSSLTPDQLAVRFVELFERIRKKLWYANITYVSMKPSPSRVHLMPKFLAANNKIRLFLKKKKNAAYIDVYHAMLGANGRPYSHIFLKDSLHMNAEGYKIWKKKIAPVLK